MSKCKSMSSLHRDWGHDLIHHDRVNAKAHPLPKKSAPGYTITRGSSSEYALAWEVSSFYPCSSAPSAAAVVQNSVREAEDIDSKLRRR